MIKRTIRPMVLAGAMLALAACGSSDAAEEPTETTTEAATEETTASTAAAEETTTTAAEETTTSTAAAEEINVFSVELGDCLAESVVDGAVVFDVEKVPCEGEHLLEVYYVFDMADGPFPGDDAVAAEADLACYEAFEPFVGIEYESSIYGYSYFHPTADSWASLGDREIQCLLNDFEGGMLIGSAAGTEI